MPRITVWHQSYSGVHKCQTVSPPAVLSAQEAHMGYVMLSLVLVDHNVPFNNSFFNAFSFFFTNSIHLIFIYHTDFQVSDVFASAIGQFELPALDKKTSESFSDFLVMQSFSEKVFLINERDSGYLKQ